MHDNINHRSLSPSSYYNIESYSPPRRHQPIVSEYFPANPPFNVQYTSEIKISNNHHNLLTDSLEHIDIKPLRTISV
jgi:hypothetical protein